MCFRSCKKRSCLIRAIPGAAISRYTDGKVEGWMEGWKDRFRNGKMVRKLKECRNYRRK